jgi:hypothetical protein
MSFHFGSWLRGKMVRLSSKRPGSTGRAVRPKDRPRRCRDSSGQPPSRATPTPLFERLEARLAPVIVTPFTVRFTANATGDIAIIGNTLETASTASNPKMTQQDVIDAQNGVGPNTDNNVACSEFKKPWFCASPRSC